MPTIGDRVTITDSTDPEALGVTGIWVGSTSNGIEVRTDDGRIFFAGSAGGPGELSDTYAQLRAARYRTVEARNEFEHFKHQVAEKAVRLADEHDWCHVVMDALHELGLEEYIPKKTGRVVVTLNIPVEAVFGTSDSDLEYAMDISVDSSTTDVDFNMDYMEISSSGIIWDDENR